MLNFVSSKNTSCFSTSTTFSSSPHLPTLHPHQKNNNNKRTNNQISQVAFNLEGGGEGGVKIVRGDFMMEDFLSCLKLLHLRVFCGHAFVGFSMFSFHQSTNYPEQCDWPSNSIYMTKYLIAAKCHLKSWHWATEQLDHLYKNNSQISDELSITFCKRR